MTHPSVFSPNLTEQNLAYMMAQKLFDTQQKRPFFKTITTLFKQNKMVLKKLDLRSKSGAPVPKGRRKWVDIQQICGSTNSRCQDFDPQFRPLNRHSQDRWISIAVARKSGKRLPPIHLIKQDGKYFVEDGHHRISVAKALGDESIEAIVVSLSK